MTCNCDSLHIPDGLPGTGTTPYAQCPKCAKKHIVQAWSAWQELSHERDNRDYCSANLRLAAEHLATLDRDLAMACHDAALRIEDYDDIRNPGMPIIEDIESLRSRIWDAEGNRPPWEGGDVKPDEPEIPPVPMIIPYRLDESYEGHGDELRILLRSIERHVSGLDRVCIVADRIPDWLNPTADGLVWLPLGNPYRSCKDANLHMKIIKAVQFLGVAGKWVFSADDCAFLRPCDLRTLPVIYNGSTRDRYAANPGHKWYRRMVNTFDYLASRGIQMSYSYDSHVPQAFEASTITERMREVDYTAGEGFCIYTLWRGLEGKTSGDVRQSDVVAHFGGAEDGKTVPLDDGKICCNYSNEPFGAGLRDRLYALFPTPSRYERK